MNSSMPTSDGGSARKNNGNRFILLLLLMLIGGLVTMQFLLPVYTAQQIGQRLQTDLEIDTRPNVRVKAFPFYKIWQGRFDQLVIHCGETEFSDLMVEEWEIQMLEVNVVPDTDEEMVMEFAAGRGYALVSESAVESSLRKHAAKIVNPKVVITADHILYSGQWDSGIVRISFSANGYPYISDNGDIRLHLERITVGPFDIPDMVREITESFLVNLVPKQEDFFFTGMKISDIGLMDGRMRIDFTK
jgi:hypothetical protein